MTAPPLPASPCMRVRLDYTNSAGSEAGSRFYLSYAGAAPTGANCITLAGDIEAAWVSNLQTLVHEDWYLAEVDVLDITTDSGLSGQWSGSEQGGDTTGALTDNVATNIEYDIARRYRGGKPRMFLPPPGSGALLNGNRWTDGFQGDVNTGIAAFFAEIEALSIGAVGALAHVNLSYYKGFTNVTNSSGRTRAAPTYRDTALLDSISGYACKQIVGSQRRRRTATSY